MFIMLGKLEEARQILAANWLRNALPHTNTTGAKDEGRIMNEEERLSIILRLCSDRSRTRPSSASLKPFSPARNFPWPAT